MSKGNELDEELRQRIICFIDTMKRTEVKLQKNSRNCRKTDQKQHEKRQFYPQMAA